jgi:hypothetical protein
VGLGELGVDRLPFRGWLDSRGPHRDGPDVAGVGPQRLEDDVVEILAIASYPEEPGLSVVPYLFKQASQANFRLRIVGEQARQTLVRIREDPETVGAGGAWPVHFSEDVLSVEHADDLARVVLARRRIGLHDPIGRLRPVPRRGRSHHVIERYLERRQRTCQGRQLARLGVRDRGRRAEILERSNTRL